MSTRSMPQTFDPPQPPLMDLVSLASLPLSPLPRPPGGVSLLPMASSILRSVLKQSTRSGPLCWDRTSALPFTN